MYWQTLNFGRYKDKMSLPQVVLHDPDYFFWGSDTLAFHRRGFPEARDLAYQARHITIPKPDAEDWCVLYDFAPGTDIFNGFKIARTPAPVESPGILFVWEPPSLLDLSVVYGCKRRDKVGNERLLRDFRLHYFGNEHVNLSRQDCEEFFENAANFYEQPSLSPFLKSARGVGRFKTEIVHKKGIRNNSGLPLIEKMNFGEETYQEKYDE